MLTEKQKIFCHEYTVDFNGSAAAIRAGYTKSRARITASRLLDMPLVQQEINQLIGQRKEKIEDDAVKVVDELKLIAYSKTTDYVKVKDITVGKGNTRKKVRVAYIELTSDIDESKQKAIAEIKQTKDGISLKSHDKVKALELLGKHYGIFERDNSQKKPEISLESLPVKFS